jgi:tRNA(Ile)-lysidine synthase
MEIARPRMSRDRIEPVAAGEFARLMDGFAPFEPAPRLAVAVSGGSDSMALALLAHRWAQARGGSVVALTVDHGLRLEAAAEARAVAARCAALGIGHETLRWLGPAPKSGLQAAARAARYRLLEDWCGAEGVLHLLLAHQREDQAETMLMRLLRGSGVDGLAAMPACVERRAVRLLRPLLTVPRNRLQATLAAVGESWIDDPSNRNPAFLRVRMRGELVALAERGLTVERLSTLAGRFGHARKLLESEAAFLMARAVSLDPAGFAWLDRGLIGAAPEAVALKAVAAVIATVSGAYYPPRLERLERLYGFIRQGLAAGRSLGGCLVLPRRGKILICREPAAMAPPVPLAPGTRARWDGRFELALDAGSTGGLSLGGLGGDALTILAASPRDAIAGVPPAARPSLPALRDGEGVIAVPALGYVSGRLVSMMAPPRVVFRPTRPLTGAGFTIV